MRTRRDCYAVWVKGKIGRRYLWARFVLGCDAGAFARRVVAENPTWTVDVTYNGRVIDVFHP